MILKNKIYREDVQKLLDSSQAQEHIFWEKELIVSYKLPSGVTVTGRSNCVDPKEFDLNKGRALCYEDALAKLRQLETYRLQLSWSALGE